MTPTEPAGLRVGLIGCGDIAPLHLDAITGNPDASLVAVADIDEQAAAATGRRYGATAYPGLSSMLERERLDVLHVCTPHDLHAPMTIEALGAGVHVLLEKPVATTLPDATAIAAAAEAGRATVGVCFQNRYNSTSRRIRELLDSGSLGKVLGGRASVTWLREPTYYAHRPWRGSWTRAGGGVLITQAIHTLDLLQWFLGPVESVRGHADRFQLRDVIEVEDTAVIHLAHVSGARSIFYATNTYVDNAPVSVELRTERAVIRLDGDLTISWADGRVEVVTETALGSGTRAYWGAAHHLLIADFYRTVLAGQRFWIDAAEATRTLEILEAVYAQSGMGGRPVA